MDKWNLQTETISNGCIIDERPMNEDEFGRMFRQEKKAGVRAAIRKIVQDEFIKSYKNNKLDSNPYFRELREINMKSIDRFMWITINPEFENKNLHDVTERLIKLVNKYVNRKNMKGAAWCFEQTGKQDADIGKHPHAHILVELNKIPYKSDFNREILNGFRNLCDPRDAFINYRICEPNHINRRISYLYKIGRENNPDIILNKKWRLQYNLNDIYFRGSFSEKNSEKNLGASCESSDEEDL